MSKLGNIFISLEFSMRWNFVVNKMWFDGFVCIHKVNCYLFAVVCVLLNTNQFALHQHRIWNGFGLLPFFFLYFFFFDSLLHVAIGRWFAPLLLTSIWFGFQLGQTNQCTTLFYGQWNSYFCLYTSLSLPLPLILLDWCGARSDRNLLTK